MGILNVTPDSFADGGRYRDAAPAVRRRAGRSTTRRRPPRRRRRVDAPRGRAGRRRRRARACCRSWSARRAGARADLDRHLQGGRRRARPRRRRGHRQRRQRPRRRSAVAAVVGRGGAARADAQPRDAPRTMHAGGLRRRGRARSAPSSRRAWRWRGRRRASRAHRPRSRLGFAKRAEHTWDALAPLDDASRRSTARSLLGPSRKSFLRRRSATCRRAERDGARRRRWACAAGAHHRVHDRARATCGEDGRYVSAACRGGRDRRAPPP